MAEADVLRVARLPSAALVVAALGGAACDGTNVIPVEVASVEVTPANATMLAGESQIFEAVPRGPDGDLLSGRFVTWSSGDQNVATVTSGGDVEARAEGATDIRATIEGVTASSSVTVLRGPEIRLDPAVLGFIASRGDGAVSPQTVEVTNASPNGQVAGLEMFIDYLTGGGTGWLSASSLNGATAPTSVTVRPNAFGLDQGTYTAEMEIRSTTAVNSPQRIQVTLSVGAAQPRISLSQTTADFAIPRLTPNPVAHPAINIGNAGGGSLTGLSAVISYEGVGGWLQASLDGTTAPTRLRLTASAGILGVGEYRATVEIRSSVAINSPQTVFVTLVIT